MIKKFTEQAHPPTFECTPTNDGSWKFVCPHCEREHWHSSGAGHRAAHCHSGPFVDEGYYLTKKKI